MNVPMNIAVRWLRHRWWLVIAVVALVAGCAYFVRGALVAGDERRASRARIEASANEAKDLAREVKAQNAHIEDQNALIIRIATAVDGATSQEARDRSAAALAGAIADLRRSIDCTAFYFAGQRPPACSEVSARLDAIRNGLDPFTRPERTTP
jgi:hypothetical protein